MVVRESAVTLAEEAPWRDTESLEQLRRNERSSSIATIQHRFHRTLELPYPRNHVVDVAIDNQLITEPSLPLRELPGGGETEDVLDVRAIHRLRLEAKLETVVLGRIVRASDLDPGDYVELVLRPVRNRSGHDADVDDVHSTRKKTAHQRTMEPFPARPVIPTYGERPFDPALRHERGVRTGNRRCRVFREILPGDAANVVLAKNVS